MLNYNHAVNLNFAFKAMCEPFSTVLKDVIIGLRGSFLVIKIKRHIFISVKKNFERNC